MSQHYELANTIYTFCKHETVQFQTALHQGLCDHVLMENDFVRHATYMR